MLSSRAATFVSLVDIIKARAMFASRSRAVKNPLEPPLIQLEGEGVKEFVSEKLRTCFSDVLQGFFVGHLPDFCLVRGFKVSS